MFVTTQNLGTTFSDATEVFREDPGDEVENDDHLITGEVDGDRLVTLPGLPENVL